MRLGGVLVYCNRPSHSLARDKYKRNKGCVIGRLNMDVHALGAHRTYNKHAVNSVTYAMRLIARLIDDTVTSWLSNKTHFITSHNVACKAIL